MAKIPEIAMLKILAGLLMASALTAPALAIVPIAGLVNTGRNAANTTVSTGAVVDAHWTLAGGTAWNGTGLNGNWLANDSASRWLTPAANANQSFDRTSDGIYTYSLNFDMSGLQPDGAFFAGRFAADNLVTSISLNGNALPINGPANDRWFGNWINFGASNGFIVGMNNLSFTVRNVRLASADNPTGLRVEFLTSGAEPVPEPATWAMLISGFGLVGAAARHRRRMAANGSFRRMAAN
jgi:hypothetical protein